MDEILLQIVQLPRINEKIYRDIAKSEEMIAFLSHTEHYFFFFFFFSSTHIRRSLVMNDQSN